MRWLSFPLLASLSLLTSILRIRNHVFKYDPVAALLTTVSAGRTGSLVIGLRDTPRKRPPPFCPYEKGDQPVLALPLRPTARLHRGEEVQDRSVEQIRLFQVDSVAAWESRRNLTLERDRPLRGRTVRGAGSLDPANPKMETVGHLSSRSRTEERDN